MGGLVTQQQYLGLDGGGSTLRALTITDTGLTLASEQSGPANLLAVGEKRAREALGHVMTYDHYDGIVAGMAGADRPWVQKFWEAALQPFADRVLVVGDYRIAWAAFTDGAPGMITIFGTGSIFYGEHYGRKARIGGYGWKIGDIGSGIALGRAAIRATLAAWEGWGPKTALGQAVSAWSGAFTPETLLNYIYAPTMDWRSVSDLASSVFTEAEAGDEAASAILGQQEQDILRQWDTLITAIHLSQTDSVGLMGGLATQWKERLNGKWQQHHGSSLITVTREPVDGAAHWAKRLGQTLGR